MDSQILFKTFAQDFMMNYSRANNKPSEIHSKHCILKNHIIPAFGSAPIGSLTARQIDAYKSSKMGHGLNPKTINNHLIVLNKMLRTAVEWGFIAAFPVIRKLRTAEPPFDFLDFAESAALVAHCDGAVKRQVILILNTGLRIGEVCALRWSDVDIRRGQLIIRHGSFKKQLHTPKSGRKRIIPLNAVAMEALLGQRHPRQFVFCGIKGGMQGQSGPRGALRAACLNAKIRPVTWHVLRHTFASQLAMRGVAIKAIQELLGHSTIEMTMRYAHLSPDVRRDAVDALLISAPSAAAA